MLTPAQPSSQRIEFAGHSGALLAARLDMPIVAPAAYAIFAHCFTCSMESKAATFISAALAEHGIAVLRFDFTGLGSSEGDFGNTNFSSNLQDLVAAAEFLRVHHRAPELLIGHSLSGTAMLAVAGQILEVRAVATLGSPLEPRHVLRLFGDHIEQIEKLGEAEVSLGGRPFRVTRQLVDDLVMRDLRPVIASLKASLLVMHSPRDTIVDIENATEIFRAKKHPKSFVSLDPADHLLSKRTDALYAGRVLAGWASRYLSEPRADLPAPLAGKVVVRETRESLFSNVAVLGRHSLRIDEPLEVGGMDSGPSPYDYLATALGACTAMTIRLYANSKKLPLERVTVEVEHAKMHADDCAECETNAAKIDHLERVIHLEGTLDEAQRAKLLEIADKCPVHRTLQSEARILTRLA